MLHLTTLELSTLFNGTGQMPKKQRDEATHTGRVLPTQTASFTLCEFKQFVLLRLTVPEIFTVFKGTRQVAGLRARHTSWFRSLMYTMYSCVDVARDGALHVCLSDVQRPVQGCVCLSAVQYPVQAFHLHGVSVVSCRRHSLSSVCSTAPSNDSST